MQRVAVYIDGMNLYYGLRSKRKGLKGDRWPCYYWLDVRRMSSNLLSTDQKLAKVCYFTARVVFDPADPDKQRNQATYLEALATVDNLEIVEGYFIPKERRCRVCGAKWTTYEEKLTDVNIGVEVLRDAYDDVFDTAIIISADGDLAAPITATLNRFPEKRIIVAFPPDGYSQRLKQIATGYISIGRDTCRRSQLLGEVEKPGGYVLTNPAGWV